PRAGPRVERLDKRAGVAGRDQRLRSDPTQLGDAPDFHPLHDIDVARVIETRAMWTDELAGHELVTWLLAQVAPGVRGAIVAQMCDHLVTAIEQRDARTEIRNHRVAILVEAEVARQLGPVDELDT